MTRAYMFWVLCAVWVFLPIVGTLCAVRRRKIERLAPGDFPDVPADKFQAWQQWELKSIQVALFSTWGLLILNLGATIVYASGSGGAGGNPHLPKSVLSAIDRWYPLVFILSFLAGLALSAMYGTEAAKMKKLLGIAVKHPGGASGAAPARRSKGAGETGMKVFGMKVFPENWGPLECGCGGCVTGVIIVAILVAVHGALGLGSMPVQTMQYGALLFCFLFAIFGIRAGIRNRRRFRCPQCGTISGTVNEKLEDSEGMRFMYRCKACGNKW
jgi:hypothetical protein